MCIYSNLGKRCLDIVAAFSLLLVLAPVLIILVILVRFNLGKPMFFCQVRPGLRGKPFTLYKFRTMTDARDGDGHLLQDAERLTPFGSFLRRASLDELPELFNVLKGDMSLVGPRPLLMLYSARYTPEQARRHEVRPGITGWAQINGRQTLLFSQRLDYDVWYVDHVNLILDLKILFLTVPRTLRMQSVMPGQDVAEIDDLGLSEGYRNLKSLNEEGKS